MQCSGVTRPFAFFPLKGRGYARLVEGTLCNNGTDNSESGYEWPKPVVKSETKTYCRMVVLLSEGYLWSLSFRAKWHKLRTSSGKEWNLFGEQKWAL